MIFDVGSQHLHRYLLRCLEKQDRWESSSDSRKGATLNSRFNCPVRFVLSLHLIGYPPPDDGACEFLTRDSPNLLLSSSEKAAEALLGLGNDHPDRKFIGIRIWNSQRQRVN
jgi:hypothetical protein